VLAEPLPVDPGFNRLQCIGEICHDGVGKPLYERKVVGSAFLPFWGGGAAFGHRGWLISRIVILEVVT